MKKAANVAWFACEVQSVHVRNLALEGAPVDTQSLDTAPLPSTALDIHARLGEEEVQEVLLYSSRVARNTCNPSWSQLSINFASPPELADCTSIVCRVYDPENKEESTLSIPIELGKLAPLRCKLEELGSLPVNTILFQMRDGLYALDKLYVLLRSRGEIQTPAATEAVQNQDIQKQYKAMQDLQDEVATLEEELRALRAEIDAKIEKQVIPFTSFERSTLMSEVVALQKIAAEREAALAAEELALQEEAETLMQLKADLEGSIKKHSEMQCSEKEAQEVLKAETNELVKTQFLLEARQVKLVSELQAIYPITLTENNEYAIRDLELPSDLNMRDDEHISSALGYVVHLVLLLSKYLEVPLRFRLIYNASRSMIKDPVLSNAALPLYKRGAEKERFDRAVNWLQRDVEQLIQSRGIAYDHSQHLLYNLQQLFTHEMAPKLNT